MRVGGCPAVVVKWQSLVAYSATQQESRFFCELACKVHSI